MAERFPRYRPLGISLAPPPRIDYAGAGAAQASSYQRLSSALDKISSYAFEEAGRRAKIEGEEFGYKLGQSPEQIKTALESGLSIDDIVGDQDTIFGAASRAAVGAQLRVELETDVRSKLAQLSAAIEGGDILDPADVETEIDAITNGHGSLLSQFGGKYAAQYRATVGTLAAPVYKSALEQSHKLRNAAQAARFASSLENARPILYSIYDNDQGGHTLIDGKSVLDSDVEYKIASRSIIDEAINSKNTANINTATEFLKNMQTNAKINALRKFARENPDQVNLNVGLFGNKTALYFSLDEDGKEQVRDEIRDERGALHTENQNQINESKLRDETRFYQIQAEAVALPDYANEQREKLYAEAQQIAQRGRFKVSKNDLQDIRVPPKRPTIPSSQDGIDRVTQMVIESYVTDIVELNTQLAFNAVRGEDANKIRDKFFSVQKAKKDEVITILKQSKFFFGPEVSKDVGKWIFDAIPVIYEMNEAATEKLLADGKRPELLTETTRRFIDLKIGEKDYNDIVKLRSDMKQEYGKDAPNFDFENSGLGEIDNLLNKFDTLRIKEDRKSDFRNQLEKLKRKLSR